jgi:glucosamine--fructose-6-phosphate aminotransferase (isomerizing)
MVLRQAAHELRRARQVVFCAIGASYNACFPTLNYLAAHKFPVQLIDAAELLHYRLDVHPRETLFVLVSQSGESIEIKKLILKIKARGDRIIGISNKPHSSLAQEADIHLLINSPADHSVAVQTYSGSLLLLYLLGICVNTGKIENHLPEITSVIQEDDRIIKQYKRASLDWLPFLREAGVFYLLARGSSLATALEGALIFNEVAKIPAVALGAGAFRHGTVEVVDNNFHGFIFAPDDDTYQLNIGLAENLAEFGGQVRVIGPANSLSNQPRLEWWHIPSISPFLAPILEIVPIQLATYRLAELKGIEPGSFRYLGPVNNDEIEFSRAKEV